MTTTVDNETRKRAVEALHAIVNLARTDASAFCGHVLRDERNGKAIRQAPLHREWHETISHHDRIILWSHIDSGKTNQIAVGRVLFELGRNPNLRVVIVSKTTTLASKITRAIGQYIDGSDGFVGKVALHEVFPGLRAAHDPALPWTQTSLTVERPIVAKDASVQACGIYGSVIGSRIDLLIVDDIIDHVNTLSSVEREKTWRWFRSTLMGRLSEDAKVVVMGNALHPDDLLHRLEREPRFLGQRFPVVDGENRITWPEHWPPSRIEAQRLDMGPFEFSRALMCIARDDETARFREEWIQACLDRGRGLRLVRSAAELAADMGIPMTGMAPLDGIVAFFTGIDLAVSRRDGADLSCLFTIACFQNGDRRVCEVRSGRWAAPEIMALCLDAHQRFGSRLIIENNAAQDYLVQVLQSATSIPMTPFRTGSNKADPVAGLGGLAAEMSNAKWIIPSGTDGKNRHREVDAWLQEMLRYDPTAHTGDRLMASWFAREGARAGARELGGGVQVRILGA